jgi:hypothetical protein
VTVTSGSSHGSWGGRLSTVKPRSMRRTSKREQEDRGVEPDGYLRQQGSGQLSRGERGKQPGSPGGDEQPGRPARGREHRALGEQMADEAPLAGPQRGTDGKLPPPRRGAGQEEVGDVGAGDEQHEAASMALIGPPVLHLLHLLHR